jgi:hypothetical protein
MPDVEEHEPIASDLSRRVELRLAVLAATASVIVS